MITTSLAAVISALIRFVKTVTAESGPKYICTCAEKENLFGSSVELRMCKLTHPLVFMLVELEVHIAVLVLLGWGR